MPVKTDETGSRRVEMELVVPGTPDEVWRAIATGPGNTGWFVRTEIDERTGGALRMDFGSGATSTGEVTIWDPPRRFGYVERDWAENAPPVATEITVTGRPGGTCVIRMVHSLFATGEDWDDQLEGFESGWPGFFEVLKLYLAHFAGMPAASFSIEKSVAGSQGDAWLRLTEALGLVGANVEDCRNLPAGEPSLAGVVERVEQGRTQRYALIRLTSAPGVALVGTYGAADTANASLAFYFYGNDAETRVSASEPEWRAWLDGIFTAG